MHVFGPFELDPSRFELRRDGSAVHLQRKQYDLLLYLMQHRDRVVSKAELISGVWGGTVVTPASLTRTMSELRRTLGERAGCGSGSVIRTVHGRGYRFAAPHGSRAHAARAGELLRLERKLRELEQRVLDLSRQIDRLNAELAAG